MALRRAGEALVLAEAVHFKVTGENVVLAALVKFFGEKTVEAFLDSPAMRFTLWTPVILIVEREGMPPESLPIVGGRYSLSEYVDPQMSAEAGLRGWSNINRRAVSRLAKKAAERTTLPSRDLQDHAIARTFHAHADGSLRSFGVPDSLDIATITPPEKHALAGVASQLLEAAVILSSRTDIFAGARTWGALTSLCRRLRDQQGFVEIAEQTLRSDRASSLADLLLRGAIKPENLPALRDRQEAKDYRSWLWDGLSTSSDSKDILDAYETMITGVVSSGTNKKVARAVVNAAVSTLVGAVINLKTNHPVLSAEAGMLASIAQNLADTFWIDKLLYERAPRRFATDVLRKFEPRAGSTGITNRSLDVTLPSLRGVTPKATMTFTMSQPVEQARVIPVGTTLTLYQD
jgi:hypothetical protein